MPNRAIVIGLTGNIATGKSSVARLLALLGADIIDADLVAHQVMCPGTAVHQSIVEHFGAGILTSSGEIDRAVLGRIVFADSAALAVLDRLVHPAVRREARRLAHASEKDVVVIEAIKLLEAGMDIDCDEIWVVTAPRSTQIERLMRRSTLSYEEARLRVDAQPSQEGKVAGADVIIENGGSLLDTRRQVNLAWKRLIAGRPPRGVPC